MPAIYTHYKFANDVMKKADKKISESLTLEKIYYKIFSQSFDNLFYYNFFLFQTNNKTQKLGSDAHITNVNLYFLNILKYMIDNNLRDNKILREYLFGSINHYVLDSTVHPYVYYKTGVYEKNDKTTYKYNGKHVRLEFMLDAYFYNEDTNKKYKDFDIAKNIVKKVKFDNELNNILDSVFFQTFNVANISKYYEKSYIHCNYIYKYVIFDKYGRKKALFSIYDIFQNNKTKAYKYNTTYIKTVDESILNLEHNIWYNPCNKKLVSEDSIIDLYNKAVEKACELITIAFCVLEGGEDLKVFLDKVGNNSYRTGLDIKSKKTMKYFE